MVVIGTSIGAGTLRYQFVFLLTTFCPKHIGGSLFWRQRSLTWTEKKKKKAPLSQQHWCFCTSLKSLVPRFTDLGGQGMNQCSLLLLGERRGLLLRGKSWSLLVVVMVDCSLRPHCPGAIICLLWESSCPVGGPRKTADRQASDQAFKFVQRFLSPNMKVTDCCWNSQYTGL